MNKEGSLLSGGVFVVKEGILRRQVLLLGMEDPDPEGGNSSHTSTSIREQRSLFLIYL